MKSKYRHDKFPTMDYTSNRFETDWRIATVVNRISPYSYHQSMEFDRGGKNTFTLQTVYISMNGFWERGFS